MRNRLTAILGVGLLALPMAVRGQDFDAEIKRIHSRLKAMGDEYHAESEWDAVVGELDALAERADRAGNTEKLIEISLLQAMVAGDMLKDYDKARTILETTKNRHAGLDSPMMRRVYGTLAETYSKLGNEAAVRALLKEFQASPSYDPKYYAYAGGAGPQDPVLLARPSVTAKDSITVTAIETQRDRAKLAPGVPFPDFASTDMNGLGIKLSDYRGKVVLVDFWVRGWYPWERQRAHVKDTYERYRDQGFEIVGICLDADTSGLDDYLERHGIAWRQIAGDRELPAQFKIFGESTSYLLDRNGIIVGRDLTGSDLVESIKSLL